MINCCVVLCWSLFVVTFHVLVLQWLFTLNWLQTFMLSYFGYHWDETCAQPLVMQILRSCSPVSKEAVSPGQPNEYRGQCHRNQTVGRKKIQPRLTPNKWKSTHEGCMNEMRQNRETWKEIWESWENYLAKAFGTVSSHKHLPSLLKATTKLLKSKAVWGTNHISGPKATNANHTRKAEYGYLPKAKMAIGKGKMPLKHCYLEYLAIFFQDCNSLIPPCPLSRSTLSTYRGHFLGKPTNPTSDTWGIIILSQPRRNQSFSHETHLKMVPRRFLLENPVTFRFHVKLGEW